MSRRVTPLLLLIVTTAALVLAGCGNREAPVTLPTVPPTTQPAPTLTMPPTSSAVPDAVPEFRFQPLWPFADVDAAVAWQDGEGAGGAQPWRLDAEETALSFAAALGFDELSETTSTRFEGDEAWVGVGYSVDGRTSTAAVLHLARIGRGAAENAATAPWEVVGTEDDVLVLDTPRYGSAATSPLTVGGTITGVDESMHVQIRDAASDAPLGDSCCVPAGGQDARWETTVSWSGGTGDALTVVAWTGGHVADVEKFALTGLER